MGIPFPTALQGIPSRAIPWAWAINGVFSVVAAPLARVVAIHLGLIALACLGAVAYILAAWALPASCPGRSHPGLELRTSRGERGGGGAS